MVEGLTIMLGVFITLLYIYTMPNIYYSATYMLLYPHLMAKLAWSWQEIEIFSWSEAWNPPTWGCKSMVEGLTIMLGVFINFVIHTIYNAKHLLFKQPTCCYTPTWWPNLPEVGRKSRFFPDLRHETRQHGAVKVWWRDLQSCWECSSPCYTSITMPNIYYSSNLHAAIPPLDGQTCLKLAEIEIFSWSEAWNPPTWGCKSMVEGLTIMLGVFITLLYILTMPNIYYSSNLHAAIPPLDGQTCLKLAENRDFFLIWGMKPANMGL